MRIGILGGGQLARMLITAGAPLGIRFRVLDPAEGVSSAAIAEHLRGQFEDPAILKRFCEGLDQVTYEWENVPVEAARIVASIIPRFFPAPAALDIVQDRLTQKLRLNSIGVPTAPFAAVSSVQELQQALERIGTPSILKTRRMGYDGKGQFVIRSKSQAQEAFEAVGGNPSVLEGFVPFVCELSMIAVRGLSGEMAFYPMSENVHERGILRTTIAPARPHLQAQAEELARKVLESLIGSEPYVGVMALELFLVNVNGEEKLWVNEIATRVHNTGHWTIEGAETSQFENHLRAGLGLPLGSTAPRGFSAMVNLIGKIPNFSDVLTVKGSHPHLYGKSERPGRKVGHVTVTAKDLPTMSERLRKLRAICVDEG